MPRLARLLLLATTIACTSVVAGGSPGSTAVSPSWQVWQRLLRVFDLAGPRSDGRLLAAAAGHLFLIDAEGTASPFAPAYQSASGAEAYIALSSGLRVGAAGCNFPADALYALRLTAPFGITEIDASGNIRQFATIDGIDSLNAITFDTVGRFDHRLIVAGPSHGHSRVFAVDCHGGIIPITDSAPPFEGGVAIAPSGFGAYQGDLIAPDEISGAIIAIDASGHSSVLVGSSLPHGGDIGLESAAFVPPGFTVGGRAYLADRGTPGNPHPGTDSILMLSSKDLVAAGVRDGDLLVAAEGGALLIDVKCAPACTSTTIIGTPTSAHAEGHLLLIPNRPEPSTSQLPAVADLGSQAQQSLLRLAAMVVAGLLILLVGGWVLHRRTRRR